jgi:ABC-2 type transport system permease protein
MALDQAGAPGASMNKIVTIVDKEWAEVFKNPMVLLTVLLLPFFFTVLPLVILYFMTTSGSGDSAVLEVPAQFAQVCGELTGTQCMQVFLVNECLLLFMMMPLAIPAAIAAYSIVGEKTTRCLEPLLATPISTAELLVGKAAAAALPAVGATWAAFLVFVVGARLIIPDPAVFARILALQWLLAVFLVGPLMAIAAVNVSIIVSSRVSDPRAAEQISLLVLIPVLAIFFGQLAGLFLLNAQLVLLTAVILALIDLALVYLGVGLFQRETILTKWK